MTPVYELEFTKTGLYVINFRFVEHQKVSSQQLKAVVDADAKSPWVGQQVSIGFKV